MNCMNIVKTGAVALMLSTACTHQFDSVNTDPNYPTTATVDLLLNPLLHSIVQNQFNYNNGSGLARHLARTNYNEVEQYSFGANEGTWSAYYLHLGNIHEIIRAAERDDRPSCQAVAYILKAFCRATTTGLRPMRATPY